jgi:hypothetical protein
VLLLPERVMQKRVRMCAWQGLMLQQTGQMLRTGRDQEALMERPLLLLRL